MGRNTGALMVAKIPVKGLVSLTSMKIDFYMAKINAKMNVNAARITKADYEAFIANAGTSAVESANYPTTAGQTVSATYGTNKPGSSNYLTSTAYNVSAFDITAIAQEAIAINEDYLYFKFWTSTGSENTDGWSINSITKTNVVTSTIPATAE